MRLRMRDGHATQATGMAFLDSQPEITAEVRKLIEDRPELQRLVRGVAGSGSGGD